MFLNINIVLPCSCVDMTAQPFCTRCIINPEFFFFFFLINKITELSLNWGNAQMSYIKQQLICNNRWGILHLYTTVSYRLGKLCHDMSCRIFGFADVFYFPRIKPTKVLFYPFNHLLDSTHRTLSAECFYDNLSIAFHTNITKTEVPCKTCLVMSSPLQALSLEQSWMIPWVKPWKWPWKWPDWLDVDPA